ncbi:motility associated factor glycosyltransferase family protein [Falsibacillus albus]|uniref:DUF115 domain-containing protein n=1 Tax=Falsibacillus albus TaxID=2478915 RepID=A0A3L7K2V1_9BACI|nr:6-hydroxymethylpterin diphosphokinase MptE-like protein [Falsibacillus albus]RLQ97140.1 DUF115 domain-containing protein [Falsibacillus albus]
MMFQENLILLTHFCNPALVDHMFEFEPLGKFEMAWSVENEKNIVCRYASEQWYIHRFEAMREEAQNIIEEQSAKINEETHVIFWGMGMGYHIEEFLRMFPNNEFTIFEPFEEVFYLLLNNRSVSPFLNKHLKGVFLPIGEDISIITDEVARVIGGRVLVIPLPSYEKKFPDDYSGFIQCLKNSFNKKGINLSTLGINQLNWIKNSIGNFPTTIDTEAILDKKRHFQNKPAIIVSAGPSLQDELENLRSIKEKKLAYIFAVGSANRALVQNEIYPDAVCSFEPQRANVHVFEEIVKNNISTIPIIYGTSIYRDSLEQYPGEKYHVITSQDVVSQSYLIKEGGRKPDVVNDAYSIAIFTYETLARLGCSPIILVGQNLAFRKGQYYAEGISYEWRDTKLTDEEMAQGKMLVEDVEGNWITTDPTFHEMRILLEEYIEKFNVETINTTKGGANIKGTDFIALDHLMENRLMKRIDDTDWRIKDGIPYDKETLIKQMEQMEKKMNEFLDLEKDFTKNLEKNKSMISQRKSIQKINTWLNKTNQLLQEMNKNEFYRVFITKVNALGYEVFTNKMQSAKEIDRFHLQKSEMVDAIEQYVMKCFEYAMEIAKDLTETHEKILKKLIP